MTRSARVGILAFALLLPACADPDPAPGASARPDERGSDETADRLAAVMSSALALADSVEDLLRPVPLLTPGEEAALRTSNAAQLARAQQFGAHVSDSVSLRRLIDSGALVQLTDSTEWWVVRELDHSLPYVVPEVVVLLEEIGRRFQEELRGRGLPAYRVEVTSVLRTPAAQAELRQGNVNAAAGTSTHEFGTTLDIAYESYAAPMDRDAYPISDAGETPADSAPASAAAPDTTSGTDAAGAANNARPDVAWLTHQIRSLALERVAAQKSREMQKLLGGVLRGMQSEGLLLVTLERQQPVYHLTVARSLRDD